MEKFDYQQMIDVADELIGAFGNDCKLVKIVGSEYDETTMKKVVVTEEYPGIAVKKQYSSEMVGNLSNIIKMGDVSFVCRFDDEVVPVEGKDKIEFDGILYNILNVITVEPAGSPTIVYRLHTRRVN